MEIVKKIARKSKVYSMIQTLFSRIYRLFTEPKWQYSPLYLLGFLYILTFIILSSREVPIKSREIVGFFGVSVFLILLTVFFEKIFSKVTMLVPTGDFKVGTQTFETEDPSREEEYIEDHGVKRKIKYQVWYPTDSTKNLEKVKWLSDGTLVPRNLVKSATLPTPSFILDYLAEIDANSYAKASLSQTKESYPVIIISHGWRGFREVHTDFAEDLASHGYFVLSIDHTYGSEAVKFDDGSVAYLNREALPRLVLPSVFSKKAQKLAVTYGEDVKLVLDELEYLNDTFQGKLNLNRIGLLGHSTGGAGDVYTALRDERVKAIIGMDAWVNPLEKNELKKGLIMPALFLRSEQWAWRESKEPLDLLVRNSTDAKIIEMADTKHLDFPMIYMISPYTKNFGLTGKHGGKDSSKIQRKVIRDFFDHHLRNKTFHKDYLKNEFKNYDHLKISD